MFLVKEDIIVVVCGQNSILKIIYEVLVSDVIREVLVLYEFFEEIRKQEVVYVYFQLVRYYKDCCLRILEKFDINVIQRVKQYVLLVDRNWQRLMDFYGFENYFLMFLIILIERSVFFFSFLNFW